MLEQLSMTLTVGLCGRLIGRCSRSAVYRTREMAARALVPFVLLTQVPSTVGSLLQELPAHPGPHVQHNHVHGTLLQVWRRTPRTKPALPLHTASAVAVNTPTLKNLHSCTVLLSVMCTQAHTDEYTLVSSGSLTHGCLLWLE